MRIAPREGKPYTFDEVRATLAAEQQMNVSEFCGGSPPTEAAQSAGSSSPKQRWERAIASTIAKEGTEHSLSEHEDIGAILRRQHIHTIEPLKPFSSLGLRS